MGSCKDILGRKDSCRGLRDRKAAPPATLGQRAAYQSRIRGRAALDRGLPGDGGAADMGMAALDRGMARDCYSRRAAFAALVSEQALKAVRP